MSTQIMRVAVWQSFQLPPFQGIHHGDCSAPLQIRNFTSESYDAIKRRERKNSKKREARSNKQWSHVRTTEDAHTSSCPKDMLKVVTIDSGLQDLVFIGSRCSHQAKSVAQDSGPVQIDMKLPGIPASHTSTSTGVHKGWVTGDLYSFASISPLAVSPTLSADCNIATNKERQQELSCNHDEAHKSSVGHDDLGTVAARLEKTYTEPRRAFWSGYEMWLRFNGTACWHNILTITWGISDSSAQHMAATTAIHHRAVVDNPPLTELDVTGEDAGSNESPAAAVMPPQLFRWNKSIRFVRYLVE